MAFGSTTNPWIVALKAERDKLRVRCEELAKANVDVGALHLADEQSVRNLRAELAEAKSKSTFRSAEVAFRDRRDLRREVDALKSQLREIKDMAGNQAKDEGLWFINASAPEAYLQQELRSLHTLIEKQ